MLIKDIQASPSKNIPLIVNDAQIKRTKRTNNGDVSCNLYKKVFTLSYSPL